MISQVANYLNVHGVKVKMIHQGRGPKCELAELVWIDENQSRELEKIIPQMMKELECASIITENIPETENLLVEISSEQDSPLDFETVAAGEVFKNTHALLPVCFGTDVSGIPQVFDLYQMRHLLLLGKNGCGKTSTLKALILSLMLKKNNNEIKFVLFNGDGEFDIYNRQSYLLTPVLNKPEQVHELLVWLCEETERRRLLFQKSGSRHIRDYHNHVGQLPYIIVVLDEFFDLTAMIKNYISLLLQKGGACGIFLVLSTSDTNYEQISFLQRSDFLSVLVFQSQLTEFSKIFLKSKNPLFLLSQGDAWLNICQSSLKRIHTCRVSTEYIKQVLTPYGKEIFPLPTNKYSEKAIPTKTSSVWDNFLKWWKQ